MMRLTAGTAAGQAHPIPCASRSACYPRATSQVPRPPPHTRPQPQPHRRRRALALLAASPDGCTEALMFANGFTAELLIELVNAGLASAHAESMVADGKMVEVAREDQRGARSSHSLESYSTQTPPPPPPPPPPCRHHHRPS